MPIFADQSRDALRLQYLAAWRKYQAQQPLSTLESQLAAVVVQHPEYQPLLERGAESLAQNWLPEQGQLNPFLHMGMHLALREQVGTDRPAGIAAVHAKLTNSAGGSHEAEHRMMDPLGVALWQAQRAGTMPDENLYLESLRQLIRS